MVDEINKDPDTTPENDSPEVETDKEVRNVQPGDQMAPATPSNIDEDGKYTNHAWYQFPNESVGNEKAGYFRIVKDELYFCPLLKGQEKEGSRDASRERKVTPNDLRAGVYDAIRDNLQTRF